MPYITNTDIQERVGPSTYLQLADDNNDGVADAAVVDEVRLGAEGEVSAYLARRYQAPIDASGDANLAGLLASVALDVAEYRLRLRRPPVPLDTQRRYDRTVAWLRAVAGGVIALPSAATLSGPASQGTVATSIGATRVLSREELSGH